MNQGGAPQSLEGITDSRSDLAWCLGTGTLGGKEQGVDEIGWGFPSAHWVEHPRGE